MVKKEFQECFSLLENEFGEQSEELKEIWFSIFNIYKTGELEEAIKYYLKKIKKLPVPAYIVEDVKWIRKNNTERAYWKALAISNKKDMPEAAEGGEKNE